MKIIVNGDEAQFGERCTVSQLLEQKSLGAAACAVEVNQMIVPKRHHIDHWLDEGDRVEIVTLVGGG